jgi:hypothetical protein
MASGIKYIADYAEDETQSHANRKTPMTQQQTKEKTQSNSSGRYVKSQIRNICRPQKMR